MPKKSAFTLPAAKKGEIWRGILVDAKGKPLHHVFETDLKVSGTHAEMTAAAKKAGLQLADCREGRLIAASDDRKRTGSFWLSEVPAVDPVCAWCQYFYDGSQYWLPRSRKLRGVAVRRVPV